MTYTRIHHEPSLEELAAVVISYAAAFAESCARGAPVPKGHHRRTFPHMLERLARGDVLDDRDDSCLAAVGQSLIDEVNAIAPGYAHAVLHGDTSNDIYFNKALQGARDRLLAWQEFHWLRNKLRCRVKAQALLAET